MTDRPVIRMRRGIWVCSRRVGLVGVHPMGHGYTPLQAFREWQAMQGAAA